MTKKVIYCAICGEKIIGLGNNPKPLDYDNPVCAICNIRYVIPARLSGFRDKDKARPIIKGEKNEIIPK